MPKKRLMVSGLPAIQLGSAIQYLLHYPYGCVEQTTSSTRPLHFSTERFLVNQQRAEFGFFATPIRIEQRLKRARAPA